MDRLQACIADALGVAPEKVTNELTYQSIPEWDSIGHMTVIAAVEGEFGVSISPEDILAIDSVGMLREVVAGQGGSF